MTLSLQEISDRLEIQDLIIAYSHAIDRRDWDALDDVFTPDAHIDYTATGGIAGSLPEIKAFLDSVMGLFSGFQHLVAGSRITVDGDRASSRTYCHNPMVLAAGGDVWFIGLWYVDELVRTPDGWRIRERREEAAYRYDAPRP